MIDWDGRAHPTVTGKNMVDDGSTVILKERKTSFAQLEVFKHFN